MLTTTGDSWNESAPLLGPKEPSQPCVAYGATLPSHACDVDGTFTESDDEGSDQPQSTKNLPSGQLVILFLLRFTAPVAFSQIFPVSILFTDKTCELNLPRL